MLGSGRNALRRLHLVLDGATVLAAMVLAARLQPQLKTFVPSLREIVPFHEHALLVYLTLPLWLALVVVLRLHETFDEAQRAPELTARLVTLHVAGLAGLALIAFVTQATINRSVVALFLGSCFVLMLAVRTAVGAWTRYQYRRGHGQPKILLVGRPGRRMTEFVADLKTRRLAPRVLGFLDPPGGDPSASDPPPALDTLERLGSLDALGRVLHEQVVDHVMFFPPLHSPEAVTADLALCEELGVPASFAVDLRQLTRSMPRITSVYDHAFVTFDVAPKAPDALAIKHAVDPIAAAVLLVLLSPVMLLVALLLLVTAGRPVLFVQERAGLFGRPFRMVKFRTMHVDAEGQKDALRSENEMSGPVFKIEKDPRVTPLGRFLRRTSIDELPQLVNVLTGSMSLVGPRPLPVREQVQIRGWQRRRLSMKPGITCLWQVSGRNELDFEDWMLLDLEYIDRWSLRLDLLILLKTLPAIVLGRGAS